MFKRVTKEEALDLIKNADLKELGKMATARKKQLHP
ncbi:MAG: dehypoxanthine futalosine cyclase, partial [Campylobacterales bacterium]|nr:dehypoxanthine futalosine cyclase [Campylobacterales bacterium]